MLLRFNASAIKKNQPLLFLSFMINSEEREWKLYKQYVYSELHVDVFHFVTSHRLALKSMTCLFFTYSGLGVTASELAAPATQTS